MQDRKIIIEIQKSGFDVNENNKIIAFTAIEMIENKLTGNFVDLEFNPGCEIPEVATKVYGLTFKDLVDKPKFPECINQILEFIGQSNDSDTQWIIHNVGNDIEFLNAEFELAGKKLEKLPIIDTLSMARKVFPEDNCSVQGLSKRFKFSKLPNRYNGLKTCKRIGEIYLHLLNCKPE